MRTAPTGRSQAGWSAQHGGRDLQPKLIREIRDGLRWMLERIESGELTAGPGLVARLEGAVEALNVLLGESSE